MRAELEGRTDVSDSFRRHIDACLGCMACVTACPSGVRYDVLIEGTRPRLEQSGSRPLADRLYRRFLFEIFPHPRRLKTIAALLRVVQWLGLQRAFRASGLARLLPPRLAALERLTPPAPASSRELPPVVAASGVPRRRVGLLLGCVQRVFFSSVNEATARVLAAEGCEVHAPREQGCCGALMLHSGFAEDAKAAARRLIDVFEALDVDQIVINAAGCGSAMKEYGQLLRDDPAYAEKARVFSARCVDISEILADLEPRAPRQPLPLKVAYHDACHLQHAQRVKQAPRRVLQTIPQLQVVEIGEAEVCCGSAGVYNLLEPDAATALGARKVSHVAQTGADVLVSSNPGCLLQIEAALHAAGKTMQTMHIVEVVDQSIRGVGTRL